MTTTITTDEPPESDGRKWERMAMEVDALYARLRLVQSERDNLTSINSTLTAQVESMSRRIINLESTLDSYMVDDG